MTTNLPTIFAALSEKNLTSKCIDQFTKDEILVLIDTIINIEDAWSPPYLKDGNELVIPFTAPKKYRWWCGGQTVKATLHELGASAEVIVKYCNMRLKENEDAGTND